MRMRRLRPVCLRRARVESRRVARRATRLVSHHAASGAGDRPLDRWPVRAARADAPRARPHAKPQEAVGIGTARQRGAFVRPPSPSPLSLSSSYLRALVRLAQGGPPGVKGGAGVGLIMGRGERSGERNPTEGSGEKEVPALSLPTASAGAGACHPPALYALLLPWPPARPRGGGHASRAWSTGWRPRRREEWVSQSRTQRRPRAPRPPGTGRRGRGCGTL